MVGPRLSRRRAGYGRRWWQGSKGERGWVGIVGCQGSLALVIGRGCESGNVQAGAGGTPCSSFGPASGCPFPPLEIDKSFLPLAVLNCCAKGCGGRAKVSRRCAGYGRRWWQGSKGERGWVGIVGCQGSLALVIGRGCESGNVQAGAGGSPCCSFGPVSGCPFPPLEIDGSFLPFAVLNCCAKGCGGRAKVVPPSRRLWPAVVAG